MVVAALSTAATAQAKAKCPVATNPAVHTVSTTPESTVTVERPESLPRSPIAMPPAKAARPITLDSTASPSGPWPNTLST